MPSLIYPIKNHTCQKKMNETSMVTAGSLAIAISRTFSPKWQQNIEHRHSASIFLIKDIKQVFSLKKEKKTITRKRLSHPADIRKGLG